MSFYVTKRRRISNRFSSIEVFVLCKYLKEICVLGYCYRLNPKVVVLNIPRITYHVVNNRLQLPILLSRMYRKLCSNFFTYRRASSLALRHMYYPVFMSQTSIRDLNFVNSFYGSRGVVRNLYSKFVDKPLSIRLYGKLR